jgi:hypothetical protein
LDNPEKNTQQWVCEIRPERPSLSHKIIHQNLQTMKQLTILSLFSILVLFSCKKSDTNTPTATIVGTWTLSELGTDNNNNNVLDAGETAPASGAGITGTVTFNSNNTYTETVVVSGSTSTVNGTYTYAGNVLTATPSGGSAIVSTVVTLTATKLVNKENSNSQWEVWIK